MAKQLVSLVCEGQVATLTLHRGDKYNALDQEMLRALLSKLDEVELDGEIRVLLVCGEGKGFCAGGDILAWGDLSAAQFQHEWVRLGHRVFDRLARLRMPTIAVLDGHAFGGGFELATAADFRVAESHIKVGLPETSLGVVPGWSGTQRAVRRYGSQIVRRLALGGEMLGADEALAAGLVDQVVDKGSALSKAQNWAHQICARGPLATEATKLMINAAEGEDREASIDALGSGFAAQTKDLKAGVAAFQGKTTPKFSRE